MRAGYSAEGPSAQDGSLDEVVHPGSGKFIGHAPVETDGNRTLSRAIVVLRVVDIADGACSCKAGVHSCVAGEHLTPIAEGLGECERRVPAQTIHVLPGGEDERVVVGTEQAFTLCDAAPLGRQPLFKPVVGEQVTRKGVVVSAGVLSP